MIAHLCFSRLIGKEHHLSISRKSDFIRGLNSNSILCLWHGCNQAAVPKLHIAFHPYLTAVPEVDMPISRYAELHTFDLLTFLLLVQTSQKEVLDYIKQSCKDFQAFADQCATYIDLYGPLVLNMAKQYLKPELCTQLGFCKAAEMPRAVSAA